MPRHVDHHERRRRERTKPRIEPGERGSRRRPQRGDISGGGVGGDAERDVDRTFFDRDRLALDAVTGNQWRRARKLRRQLLRSETHDDQYRGRGKQQRPHDSYHCHPPCIVHRHTVLSRRRFLRAATTGAFGWRLAAASDDVAASAGEVLYNGIVLGSPWPPRLKYLDEHPVLPPYL